MILNTSFYQIYDKEMNLDYDACRNVFFRFLIIIFINDLILLIFQRLSVGGLTKYGSLLNTFLIFIALASFQVANILIFTNSFEIEGYYRYFHCFKYIWIITTGLRSVAAYNEAKVISDIIRIFEPILLINLILIAITDPIINVEQVPNKVTFYEIYFRFIEFQIIVLGFNLIYFDSNIDTDVDEKQYTLAAVIGKYDCFRFTVFIIIIHYFFILINMIAFSYK